MLLGAGPASAVQKIDEITNIPIGTSGQNLQTGKLHAGAASNCNSPKTVPTVDPGSFRNVGFDYESHINEPTCLTIEYSTADAACQTAGLFSAAYLGGFNPTAIQTNYAGDIGAAPTNATPVSYSVLLPPGQRLSIDFHMTSAGAGCAGFNFKVFSDHPWIFFQTPVSGHPFVGQQLRSREEVWEDSGNSTFTRQWRRCARDGSSCVDIPGATAQTYVPVPDDVGHALRVHVAATDGGLTSTSESDPVVVGVQFDAADGQSLNAPDPTQKGRLFATVPASGCDSSKAVPALFDNPNTRLYDVFRHTNDSGGTVCAVVSALPAPTCPNKLLSAAYLPGFDPATSVLKNYLADSGFSASFGAETARYSFPVPAGAGYDVVVSTFGAGDTCTGYDVRFGTASPYPTGAPGVDGTPQAGQTLTATDGAWTGAPQSFGYQWQRCFGDGSGCADIPGATAKTLTPTARQVGDSFRVRVTATEGIGSASKTSAASAAVAEAPPEPPPPGPPAWAGIALKPVTKVVGSKGVVTLSVSCPTDAVLGCAGSDAVKLGKATLDLQTFALAPGSAKSLKFTLSKAVRKRLIKRKKLAATQVVNSFDMRGLVVKTSAKLTLKRR
jgi:hypothetical protein